MIDRKRPDDCCALIDGHKKFCFPPSGTTFRNVSYAAKVGRVCAYRHDWTDHEVLSVFPPPSHSKQNAVSDDAS